MRHTLLSLFGLKFHPFRADVPHEALYPMPVVDSFIRRVEMTIADGGFTLVSGNVGTGKSVALRLLAHRLRNLRDVVIGSIDYPQSRLSDFYREMGDIFGVQLSSHNRWGGFKGLRQRWADHIASTTVRPVLIVDEAQEMHSSVLNELRMLTSKEFDSSSLLCIVLAGDARLTDRLREPDMLPLGSRVRRRLLLDTVPRDQLLACLQHVLAAAGNEALMTPGLKAALVDHAMGNLRVMMNMGDELLAAAAERQVAVLDEQLYLDVYPPPPAKKGARR